jgi:hypothetical protein
VNVNVFRSLHELHVDTTTLPPLYTALAARLIGWKTNKDYFTQAHSKQFRSAVPYLFRPSMTEAKNADHTTKEDDDNNHRLRTFQGLVWNADAKTVHVRDDLPSHWMVSQKYLLSRQQWDEKHCVEFVSVLEKLANLRVFRLAVAEGQEQRVVHRSSGVRDSWLYAWVYSPAAGGTAVTSKVLLDFIETNWTCGFLLPFATRQEANALGMAWFDEVKRSKKKLSPRASWLCIRLSSSQPGAAVLSVTSIAADGTATQIHHLCPILSNGMLETPPKLDSIVGGARFTNLSLLCMCLTLGDVQLTVQDYGVPRDSCTLASIAAKYAPQDAESTKKIDHGTMSLEELGRKTSNTWSPVVGCLPSGLPPLMQFKGRANSIMAGLYVGDEYAAQDRALLRALCVRAVVNVTAIGQVPNFFEGISKSDAKGDAKGDPKGESKEESKSDVKESDISADIAYLRVPIDDDGGSEFLQWLPKAFEFIRAHILNDASAGKSSVLVHCSQGVSRSCGLVTAYLMNSKQWEADDALKWIVSRRVVAKPNVKFMRHLALNQEMIRKL